MPQVCLRSKRHLNHRFQVGDYVSDRHRGFLRCLLRHQAYATAWSSVWTSHCHFMSASSRFWVSTCRQSLYRSSRTPEVSRVTTGHVQRIIGIYACAPPSPAIGQHQLIFNPVRHPFLDVNFIHPDDDFQLARPAARAGRLEKRRRGSPAGRSGLCCIKGHW